jgi:hypothetical protein
MSCVWWIILNTPHLRIRQLSGSSHLESCIQTKETKHWNWIPLYSMQSNLFLRSKKNFDFLKRNETRLCFSNVCCTKISLILFGWSNCRILINPGDCWFWIWYAAKWSGWKSEWDDGVMGVGLRFHKDGLYDVCDAIQWNFAPETFNYSRIIVLEE